MKGNGASVRTFWLLIAVSFWFTACRPIQEPTPACDTILGTSLHDLRGQVVGREQLLRLVEQEYGIDQTQIEMLSLQDNPFWRGGDVWYITWSKGGVSYDISVDEDSVVSRIDILYKAKPVTVKEVIDCIGQAPEHYRASYRLELPPNARRYYRAIFIMSFTSLGIVTTSHETSLQPFTPFVNEHTPIGALVFIQPGSPQQVFNRAFGLPDEAELTFDPQPWPGSWDEIQFVDIRAD